MAKQTIKSYTFGWDSDNHTGGIRIFDQNKNAITTFNITNSNEFLTILKILETGKDLFYNDVSRRIISQEVMINK
jgi:hypothetical protein